MLKIMSSQIIYRAWDLNANSPQFTRIVIWIRKKDLNQRICHKLRICL
jgi:hypothetical protein